MSYFSRGIIKAELFMNLKQMFSISDEILLRFNNLKVRTVVKTFNLILSRCTIGTEEIKEMGYFTGNVCRTRKSVARFDEYTTVLWAPLQNYHYEAFESTISFLSLWANYAARWNPTFIPPNDGVKQCPLSHNLRK